MEYRKFTYGVLNNVTRLILLLFAVLGLVIGLVYLWGLLSILLGYEANKSLSETFWSFIGYFVWTPLFWTFYGHLTSDVEIDDKGLRTKFLFRTLIIPWNEIAEFRPGKVFGFRMIKKASIVVVKNGLTPFHRLYGLMYGRTSKPTIVIWSYINGYDELVVSIKQSLKNRTKANR